MNAPAQTYEQFLEAMVEEIRVPDSMYESADRSYHSFGEWVHRPESELLLFNPEVYSQGSFRLGTAIKPITNADEYDVDAVCELRKLGKDSMSQSELKKLVGKEVHKYHEDRRMTEPVHEGNRCWRLDYAEGARFHMDILPAIPNAEEQIAIMTANHRDPTWANTAIAITDKRHPNYNFVSSVWPRSNPKGYFEWFVSRQIFSAYRRKAKIIENQRALGIATMSVEDLPEYRARTPLQSAIMILKRHRDNMFARNPDIKPISIIITTLAGHSYDNEDTIREALQVILAKMDRFIRRDGQKYIIENPADPFENFADKWEYEPEKAKAFYDWLEQAREDFAMASQATSVNGMAVSLQGRMGVATAARAADRVTGGSRLLRSAASASAGAASMPSFANAERKPTAPKEYG
jgi:hypothetical protein